MSSTLLGIHPKRLRTVPSHLPTTPNRIELRSLMFIARLPLSPTQQYSTHPPTKPIPPSPQKPPRDQTHNAEQPPSLNLFVLLREAKPAVRYTVYAGLGLMATAETTFWFSVIRAKYFPSEDGVEKGRNVELLENVREAVQGYRKAYLENYRGYYGGYVWGVGER